MPAEVKFGPKGGMDVHYCLRHMEEPSTAQCRSCRGTFCARCLVYSFGPRKPPYCVGCALYASGVRSGTRHTAPMPAVTGIEGPAPLPTIDPVSALPPGQPVAETQAEPHGWRARRARRRGERSHDTETPSLPAPGQEAEPLDVAQALGEGDTRDTTVPAPSQLQLSGPLGATYSTDS